MTDPTDKRRRSDTNHALQFIKTWWFLIVFSLAGIGTIVTLWFDVQYVVASVNPDSIGQQRVKEAVRETKIDIRWCIQKLYMQPPRDVEREVLACTD